MEEHIIVLKELQISVRRDKQIVMKTTTLFRLGAIAMLISVILVAIQDAQYFLGGQQSLDAVGLWVGIFADVVRVLGVFALFAWQAQRGGVLGVIGLVLLVCGSLAAVGFEAVGFGTAAGVFTQQQLTQVPAYAIGTFLLTAFLVSGEIIFGISIYLAHQFPKYAGVLLALVGVLHYLTGPVALTRPVYAILSVAVYAWLGWALYRGGSAVSLEPAPTTPEAALSFRPFNKT